MSDGTLTDVGLVTVTVTGVNNGPTATPQNVTTPEDTGLGITLAGTDPENNPLTFAVVAGPTNGTLSGTAPNLTYTPNANASGLDLFSFTVSDGTTTSAPATVTITITAVNDAPVALDGAASIARTAILNAAFAATDVDGPSFTYSIVSNGVFGTAVITDPSTGAFVYTPSQGSTGGGGIQPLQNGSSLTDTIQFKVNDGNSDSNIASFVVTLVSDFTPPFHANDALVAGREDVPVVGRLSATGASSGRVRFVIVSNGALGTAILRDAATGRFVYVPNRNASGTDTFTFQVIDGDRRSNVATMTVVVASINDAPVARAGRHVAQFGGSQRHARGVGR